MNLTATLNNADAIFEAAKRLKAAAARQKAKTAKTEEIYARLRTLRAEANAATTAMVNSEDLRDHRDLAEIARDIKVADGQLDRAIEASHNEGDDAGELAEKLQELLDNEIAPAAESDEGYRPAPVEEAA